MSVSSGDNSVVGPIPTSSSIATLQQQMELLQATLRKELTKLDTNWNTYEERKAGVDLLRERILQTCIPKGDRLRLNVGGKRFEISSVFTKNNAYFKRVASEGAGNIDDDGFYFEDRNPQYIHVVMQFLRAGSVRLGKYSQRELELIRQDAEFYMVHGLVELIDKQMVTAKRTDNL